LVFKELKFVLPQPKSDLGHRIIDVSRLHTETQITHTPVGRFWTSDMLITYVQNTDTREEYHAVSGTRTPNPRNTATGPGYLENTCYT